MNILQALDDPNVFGRHFRGGTWDAWRAFLAALFALPMTPQQLALFQKHTGRTTPSSEPLREAWLVCGRRAGKSFVLATIAIFLAAFKDWRPYLGPNEAGTVMICAADRRQARVIMRYCLGLLRAVPMLRQLIEGETRESIALRNRVVIEIHTASFRSTRGYTIVAALLDELAYWPVDEYSAAPDVEVINAIRPGLVTVPGSILLAASSPHARRGALWEAHRRHYGRDGDPILVWQAPTLAMNSSVPPSVIDAAVEEDPARAQAEWCAQFRTDVETYIPLDVVEGALHDLRELPPAPDVRYWSFVDPAGGSGEDSFTLALAHKDGDRIVVDAVRERRPPFSPAGVVADYCELLKFFRVTEVVGDRWAAGFAAEAFKQHGVRYTPSAKTKSDLYLELLPLLNSGRVVLPRSDRLVRQLLGLERRTARGGRDSIDHAPGGHDDLANAVAGACAVAAKGGHDIYTRMDWVCGPDTDLAPVAAAPR